MPHAVRGLAPEGWRLCRPARRQACGAEEGVAGTRRLGCGGPAAEAAAAAAGRGPEAVRDLLTWSPPVLDALVTFVRLRSQVRPAA